MPPTDPPSPYALAIDATRSTLGRRARRWRALVGGLSVFWLLLAACAAASGRRWLLGVLLTPSAVLAFHAFDRQAVQHWRGEVLRLWAGHGLRLDLLARTLDQVPGLPAGTLQGMTDSLPAWPPHGALPAVLAGPLCRVQEQVAAVACRQLLLRAVLWSAGVALLLAAWLGRSPALLGLLPALPLVAWAWAVVQARRLRALGAATRRLGADAGVPAGQLAGWLDALCWEGVPPRLKAACSVVSPPAPPAPAP